MNIVKSLISSAGERKGLTAIKAVGLAATLVGGFLETHYDIIDRDNEIAKQVSKCVKEEIAKLNKNS